MARVAAVLEDGRGAAIGIAGESVKVTAARFAAIIGEVERRENLAAPEHPGYEGGARPEADGPVILNTLDNFRKLSW